MANKAMILSYGKLKHLSCRFRSGVAKDSAPLKAFTLSRKGVHTATCDKNIDEVIVRPTVVPDKVIGEQPGTYWAPHPHTGVFGPTSQNASSNPEGGAQKTVVGSIDQNTDVWFRPLEVADKPEHS
ncbi:hypothetical protein LUZ63_010147 [Rhynchospora breviuscula]|uniref:Uncharacterized protein n=1 Tax=Rhynchospora breviuscula TaxID=2022672 RepID=A0A9Q0HPB5_9POAL|nr:hypothetical protein LUZ63_010147 [Rhynchospora breviuscula]